MAPWVVDENGEQVIDESGNRVYIGENPEGGGTGDVVPQGSDPQPPHIIGQAHYHGLQRREVSNFYKVPVEDAYVTDEQSFINYGNSPFLWVEETDPYLYYTYIKATPLENFASGHTLDQGFLNIKRIYDVAPPYITGSDHISFIEVRRVVATWDESTITWNNKAAEGAEFFNVELRNITEDTWISIDIKDWLQNWVDGVWDNYGLVLKPIYDDPKKRFHSNEAAEIVDRPYLSLYYFPTNP